MQCPQTYPEWDLVKNEASPEHPSSSRSRSADVVETHLTHPGILGGMLSTNTVTAEVQNILRKTAKDT